MPAFMQTVIAKKTFDHSIRVTLLPLPQPQYLVKQFFLFQKW